MTYPVTVYRWDDAGAPQITTDYCSANDLKAILQACLVTGYGSKAGLGWSKVFDDASGVVWQNNIAGGGSGGMFRLRPKSGNWATAGQGISTGLGILPAKAFTSSTVSDKPGLEFTCAGNIVTAGVQRGWVLIGTAIGFFFEFHSVDPSKVSTNIGTKIIHNTSLGRNDNFYIGDLNTMIAGDAYKFTGIYANLTATGQTSMPTSYSLSGIATGGTMNNAPTNGVLLYDTDGGTGSKIYGLCGAFNNLSTPYAENAADLILLGPVLIYSESIQNTAVTSQTAKHPSYRGIIPGVLVSLYAGGNSATYWPSVRAIDGVNHWLVGRWESGPANQGANMWINMVEW